MPKTTEKTPQTTHKEPLKMQVKVIIPYMLIVTGLALVAGVFIGYVASINVTQDARAAVVRDMSTASK